MGEPVDHAALAPALPTAPLPWWEDGQTLPAKMTEPAPLARGIRGLWHTLRRALLLPLSALDARTCDATSLDLLAWERDITRFPGEPLDVYRLRVHHAFVNAQDAGGTAGFVRIFARFGITLTAQLERIPGMDWDVILLLLDEHTPQVQEQLASTLVAHYRRTCRRYGVGVTASAAHLHAACPFAASFHTITAHTELDLAASVWAHQPHSAGTFPATFVTMEAQWPQS